VNASANAGADNWPGPDSTAERIVDPPRVGRWFGIAAVALALSWIAFQVITNPGFQWSIVGRYMFASTVLRGVAMTIQLTFVVMAVGVLIGIVVALMRLSRDPLLNFCAHGYVWFFRGTPVLVQLVFWYNLAALFPQLSFGIPFGGPKFFEIPATVAISSFTAALLGLGLNEGAYMAEIIRAGLLSVDSGQTEASKALGHRPWQTFRIVVLPQAMKAIVPPTGNQVIGMLKYTSLASVVALHELMHSVETIYSRTFETMPLLIVAALWYLILVSILSVVQFFIERHYLRGWQAEVHPLLEPRPGP
jgi:polar amino acid transport system permease protein